MKLPFWSDEEPTVQPEETLFTGKHQSLQQILQSVRAGACCRVLGPRLRAKSQLMREAARVLEEEGFHFTAYQSLKDLPLVSGDNYFASLYRDVPLVHESDFFAGLFSELVKTLSPNSLLLGQPLPQSAFAFQIEFLRLIRRSERNIAIFIDDLEAVPPNLVALLLDVLQSVYMTVVDRWGSRFQAVVCGSLSFSQLTLENATYFESVSDLVMIPDLTQTDCEELVSQICQKVDLHYDSTTAPFLSAQTGGDAHLITRILNLCISRMSEFPGYPITPARLDEAIDEYLTQEPDSVVLDTIEQIQSDPNLLSCALQILAQEEMHISKLPIPTTETPNAVDLCAAFANEDGRYWVKCDLWRQLLLRHLAPAQIGGWYAVAGYWDEAIDYLGRAVRDGHKQMRAELFAVIINAIHVSENYRESYRYLGMGLEAAYPHTAVRLYRRGNDHLELLHTSENVNDGQFHIPLSDKSRDEIEALDGPDYSLASINRETYLMIPLRVGKNRTFSIGLVVLGGLFTASSPYQQRKDVLRFVEFLRQVSRAIRRAELYEQDKQRQQLLDQVAIITPKISAQLEMDQLYRVVIEQIMRHVPHADYGCIVELDEENQKLRITRPSLAYYPVDESLTGETYVARTDDRVGIATRAILNQRPYLVNDVSQDADYLPAIRLTQAELCVPIKIQEQPNLAMVLESRQKNAFTPKDLDLLRLVAEHVGIAIRNATQFQNASDRQLRERTAMMATGLIHDINSAVASIPDLVEEVRTNLQRGKLVDDPLNDLEKNANQTTRLSKRLRDFVVTQQQEASLAELQTLIDQAVDISEGARPAHVKTIVNMNGLNIKLKVDYLWIELLLKNLLVNAYESMPPLIEGVVTVDVAIDQDHIYIHVSDNGEGIAPEAVDQIFELGFTTKGGSQMHGVGLYHCRMIAEAHHGQLTVSSTVGKGTRFTLQLPRGHHDEVQSVEEQG